MSDFGQAGEHRHVMAIGKASDGLPVDLDECGLCGEEWPCRRALLQRVEEQRQEIERLTAALSDAGKLVDASGLAANVAASKRAEGAEAKLAQLREAAKKLDSPLTELLSWLEEDEEVHAREALTVLRAEVERFEPAAALRVEGEPEKPHRFVVPWDEQQGLQPCTGWRRGLLQVRSAPLQASRGEPALMRPRIICLCGSTRFVREMAVIAWCFERDEGVIALGLHLLPDDYPGVRPDHMAEAEGKKEHFDELHKRKIDLADEVFVVNVGGYIGESTRSEIEYARAHGKPIRWLEPEGGDRP